MGHTIQIPDQLWDAYHGSPMMMRDVLWQNVVPTPSVPVEDPKEVLFERDQWALRFATKCSVCRGDMDVNELAVYQIHRDDSRSILHPGCV